MLKPLLWNFHLSFLANPNIAPVFQPWTRQGAITMRLLLCVFCLLMSSLLPASTPVQDAESQHMAPIIGGNPAVSQWPWLLAVVSSAQIDPQAGLRCNATLISPVWALTAAHCVENRAPASIEVFSGSNRLLPALGRRHGVAAIHLHPDYVSPLTNSGPAFDNDIALLRLVQPIGDITPVDLSGPVFDELAVPPGTNALIKGWGARQFNPATGAATDLPRELQALILPVRALQECIDAMGNEFIKPGMFCAGTLAGGADTCVGDSGTALAVTGPTHSSWVQIGLSSWGFGCGQPGSYGVYSNIGHYTEWITAMTCHPMEVPDRPRIVNLHASNGFAGMGWHSNSFGVRFRVYYASAETMSPIRYMDVGTLRQVSAVVPRGLPMRVAVQAYRGRCNGPFSEIHGFTG